jgi:hypothetical protein
MTPPPETTRNDQERTTPSRGNGAKWPRYGDKAIAALIEHGSVDAAARSIQVDPCTLKRWLTMPEFQEKLKDAGDRLLDHSLFQLQRILGLAVDTLERSMLYSNENVRVAAARCVLDRVFKTKELIDLEARLTELEGKQAKKGKVRR